MKYVLLLGRVTSKSSGSRIVNVANEILKSEFSEIFYNVKLVLPDESIRRVGQSIAAASLPKI